MARIHVLVLLAALAIPAMALSQDTGSGDATPGFPFKVGDTITYDDINKLEKFLPPEFWEHRDYFFYEGMGIKVGETRDYSPAQAYKDATEKHKGTAKIGRDGALVDYVSGQPFTEIDCKGDPKSATKIIWNFMKHWEGDGGQTEWSYTYWDRGEQLPLYYEGAAKGILLSSRVEPKYEETGGDIFKNEKRQNAFGVDVLAPFDARGIILLQYRYKAADNALDETRNDDTWVYVPDLRRTRRISTAQRTDSVQGTDFTFDDLRSFSGIPPQYEWSCIGERKVLAPMATENLAYPYSADEYNFGPYGFSFANDRWEVRDAYLISFDPRNDDHPYSRKDIYVDKETYEPLYSFAYDRREELWKIIWHTSRWPADWVGKDPKGKDGVWYGGWEGVPEPRDARLVSDIIVNTQTGTGNRIEYWDSSGAPLSSRGKIRRYIDIGRLNKGR